MAETASSGAEVPKPIITMPISRVGMPSCLAVAAAPSTNLSALQTSSTSPTIMAPIAISIGKPRLFQRSEEHTSELQSRPHLVCRLLLEKKKKKKQRKKPHSKKRN